MEVEQPVFLNCPSKYHYFRRNLGLKEGKITRFGKLLREIPRPKLMLCVFGTCMNRNNDCSLKIRLIVWEICGKAHLHIEEHKFGYLVWNRASNYTVPVAHATLQLAQAGWKQKQSGRTWR